MARDLMDYYLPPLPPVRGDKPLDERMREYWQLWGWLDKNGKITKKGIKDGKTQEEVDGCETDEQFAVRMRRYEKSVENYRAEYKRITGHECPPI